MNIHIIYVSEVGGSEFAFRQAPRNREIVSCRACVRAVNAGWKCTSKHILHVFLFPFMPGGLSRFPCEICESVNVSSSDF